MIRSRKTGLPAVQKSTTRNWSNAQKTRRGVSPTGQFGCPILHEGAASVYFKEEKKKCRKTKKFLSLQQWC